MIRPLESCVLPADHAHEVVFAAGSEHVVGAEFGTGTVGVVMAHEFMADLCNWVPYAEHLRSLGYRTLAFDFQQSLVSEVESAARQLRRDGAHAVVLMGASMGATASLAAATTIAPQVAGVASLSGPSMYGGIDALSASKQLTIPVLYMDSESDDGFTQDAHAMYAACPSARKQLAILPGDDHGTQLLRFTVETQAYAALDRWLAGVAP